MRQTAANSQKDMIQTQFISTCHPGLTAWQNRKNKNFCPGDARF